MSAFFYNPQPGVTATAQALTEAQWRGLIARWLYTIDPLEAQLVANVGVQWFRAPDGDYWFDANSAAPPAFTPGAPNTANANMQVTDNTIWDSNFPP